MAILSEPAQLRKTCKQTSSVPETYPNKHGVTAARTEHRVTVREAGEA